MSNHQNPDPSRSPLSGRHYSLGRVRTTKELNLPDCPEWELMEYYTGSNYPQMGRPDPVGSNKKFGHLHPVIPAPAPALHPIVKEDSPLTIAETMIPIEVATMLPTPVDEEAAEEVLAEHREQLLGAGEDENAVKDVLTELRENLLTEPAEPASTHEGSALLGKFKNTSSQSQKKEEPRTEFDRAAALHRVMRHGVLDKPEAVTDARWLEEAQDVLIWKADEIEKILLPFKGTDSYDADLSAAMKVLDPELTAAIDPPLTASSQSKAIAVAVKHKLGLETFEMGQFWSRVHPTKRWRAWRHSSHAYSTGFLYEPIPEAIIRRHLQVLSDGQHRTEEGKLIGTISTNKRTDIIKELADLLNPAGGNPAFFSDDYATPKTGIATSEKYPRWINIEKGYGGEFGVTSRFVDVADRARFALKCSYDPEAKCPVFEKFLEETFAGSPDKDEKIEALLEWIAAAVFGRTTKLGKGLYLYGDTSTGKSVVCDLVQALFPEENITSLSFRDLSERFGSAPLANSRLNVMTEASPSGLQKGLTSDVFKKAIVGEMMMSDVKNRDRIRFKPNCALIFAANGRLPLSDTDESIFRRLIVIQFENRVKEADQDVFLVEKLKKELSGILNLILRRGVKVFETDRIVEPSSSRHLKTRWLSQNNSVKAWLDDACSVVEWKSIRHGSLKSKSTLISPLHRFYKNWCEVDGLRPVGSREFRNRLDGVGIVAKQKDDGTRVPVVVNE